MNAASKFLDFSSHYLYFHKSDSRRELLNKLLMEDFKKIYEQFVFNYCKKILFISQLWNIFTQRVEVKVVIMLNSVILCNY